MRRGQDAEDNARHERRRVCRVGIEHIGDRHDMIEPGVKGRNIIIHYPFTAIAAPRCSNWPSRDESCSRAARSTAWHGRAAGYSPFDERLNRGIPHYKTTAVRGKKG